MTEMEPDSTVGVPAARGELQLVSDGDGLAIIGKSSDVERFLVSQGLERAPSKDLTKKLAPALQNAAMVVNHAAKVSSESGRWVQLTAESAEKVAAFGLMPTSTPGVSHAMIGDPGAIQSWIQIASGPASLAANPAILAGAAGIMAQVAMKQMMEEITDYLATIDEKVDDILRAQKDAVLADMIGVDLIIDEAMTIREQVGRVSEVTWSKVQGTSATIAKTQAYALRQLDALAEKLEYKSDMGELAASAKAAEASVQEWLAVLAHCVQLQTGISVLELDRVLDASPAELNQHRVALRLAQENRIQLIARHTVNLLARMKDAADRANTKVLMHPMASPTVVRANNTVTADVVEFQERIGLTADGQSLEARRWKAAFGDTWSSVLQTGSDGLDAAGRVGSKTLQAFQSVDRDGDGVADKPLALSAIEETGSNVAGAITSLLRRRPGKPAEVKELESDLPE